MFVDKASPIYKVEDIDGWGTVCIRSQNEFDRCRRAYAVVNDERKNGVEIGGRRVSLIIDQLCDPETKEPLFTEKDRQFLHSLTSVKLDPIYNAIDRFNEVIAGNE